MAKYSMSSVSFGGSRCKWLESIFPNRVSLPLDQPVFTLQELNIFVCLASQLGSSQLSLHVLIIPKIIVLGIDELIEGDKEKRATGGNLREQHQLKTERGRQTS